MGRHFFAWAAGMLCVVVTAPQAAGGEPATLGWHLLETAGISRGLCCVIGCDDPAVIMQLAEADGLLVHALDRRSSQVADARKTAEAAELYGRRVVIEESFFEQLPYADNVVDLIVATHLNPDTLERLSPSEMLRVLRPMGRAVLGSGKGVSRSDEPLTEQHLKKWLQAAGEVQAAVSRDDFGLWAVLTKGPLQGVDEWSHWEHGPDNNPVSTDAVIKAPYMTQWLAEPYYIAMPAVTTVAGGRTFVAMGHIAHHEREEPWLNTIYARNGYNGTELWTRKLPDGYLVHRSAFIATAETFYMIDSDGEGCLLLDPQTGREKGRVRLPQVPGQWKWMALKDGVLFALLGKQPDPSETTLVRSSFGHWSWGELSKGYYAQRIPWGFGATILAYDLGQKKVLWTHTEEAPIDSRAMVMGGGEVFFYGPDSHVGCLDAASGKVLWTNADPKIRQLVAKPGRHLKSTPGFRTTCYSVYSPKALFYQAQTRMNVVAVSTEDGSLLWHRRKTTNNPNTLYVDGQLLVGIGPNGNTLVVDPLTGNTIEDLGFRKRSCARLTATPDSLFCRGWPEGLTRYDRNAKKILFNAAVRPSCNDGVIGANGLLYMGPWLCDCNLSLMGSMALCSAGDFEFDRQATEAERLEVGRQDLVNIAALEVTAGDWPTCRANTARTAATQVEVPRKPKKAWQFRPQAASSPTTPTAAGGLIFWGDGNGKVRAIDAATGQLEWCFLTAGPIMQPPTIWKGRAYVGSGDGYIYALEAATGQLLWRFRAAPVERRIMVYGSLCSTWPVNTGVLVEDGVAYAAAGIIDYDGTYVYALDAVTGKIKWQNNSSGHLNSELRKGASAQGVLTIAAGRLWMPGGNVVSPAAYDLQTGQYVAGPAGNGAPRANRGQEIGVLNDNYLILGGRLRYSAVTNVVNPGNFVAMAVKCEKGTGPAMPLTRGKIPPAWNADRIICVQGRNSIPVCYEPAKVRQYVEGQNRQKRPKRTWAADDLKDSDIVCLVVGPNAVLAVCETQRRRPQQSRWRLCGLKAEDGSLDWERPLQGPALPGGCLVDQGGRVIVVMEDGSVVCFAPKGASST